VIKFNSLTNFLFLLKYRNNFKNWKKRNFNPPSPDFIKHQIIKNNNLTNSIWIETGTYYGETTNILSKISNKVITIEADKRLFQLATNKFKNYDNIEIVNERSENILDKILRENIHIKNVCLYLDAHLCTDHITGSSTYGKEDSGTPIMKEMSIIEKDIINREKLVVLIDDIRLFDKKFQNYSSKNELVTWCKKNKFEWEIEHDIFIAKKI
jgi:hypothetical protein